MLNLNNFVTSLADQGSWVAYSIIFLIILCETGLVIMPFLPGDSLLFLCGSIATLPHSFFNVELLLILLSFAAFLGDSLNFEIGNHFGKSLTKPKWSKWIKPNYLRKTNDFFKYYGSNAVFLGRFAPIIRTLVPFTAGISKMPYRTFAFFNVCGGIAWVSLGILSGYFFGNIPLVKNHFELLMMAIIVISLLPILLIKFKKNINLTTSHKTLKGNDLNEKK
ncbi:MAG: VTT domain-containing protein [Liquorilactobacillus nagelii]|jgi:membrane-associated protein|uniref:VTT domain-containing protein n=1 Tax=Liquorilactobacillus nagelii TaxID=82688 RepID=UPI00242E613C|nr:VTT domain-containing protein [Liquorilactobacillus nagelii]MCI1634175.1 VTT domain-containing protein [Liquorilactobacillus nagelii]MCI1921384.1 VTT domain-containing protein [Liquorilactobacillus nagelii]MCI1977516.1 VTT domain-containing protein [Liquorilactobacillus nagelii]